MKRSSRPKRLLTPAQMQALHDDVLLRDKYCIGKGWKDHECGGYRNGSMYEPEHVIQQQWMKTFLGVDASRAAADPDTCVNVCCNLHDQITNKDFSKEELQELYKGHLPQLEAAARKYHLWPRLKKELGLD